MVKKRKNGACRRQTGKRFQHKKPSKAHMNFRERANDGKGPSKEKPIHPNRPAPQQAAVKTKKRVMMNPVVLPTIDVGVAENKDYSASKRKKTGVPNEDTGGVFALGHFKAVNTMVSSVGQRRHFYSYNEQDIYANEPQLSCSICNSKVLVKFLELHAWMHLSWTVQVGDRNPFQCTYCDFAAFRIPDVICHSKETHGNVSANLFVPTVSHEILESFLKKVMECFSPKNDTHKK